MRGALKAGGPVISVLGGGIDFIYPRFHRDLYADVAAAGALVSEYPPGTESRSSHFPVRNRIISGLSLGVAVVELSLIHIFAIRIIREAYENHLRNHSFIEDIRGYSV